MEKKLSEKKKKLEHITRNASKLFSIVGALNKKGNDVAKIIIDMMEATIFRGLYDLGIYIGNALSCPDSLEKIDTNRVKGNIGVGLARFEIGNGDEKIQPIRGRNGAFIVLEGKIYNYRNLNQKLAKYKIISSTDAEVVLHIFEDFMKNHGLIEAIRKTMYCLDGDYVFVIAIDDKLIVSRDPVGIKPMFLAENEQLVAFSSERKALWKIGPLNNIRPLLPGNFAIIDSQNLRIYRGYILEKRSLTQIDFVNYRDELLDLLIKSVRKRIENKKFGILYSGGLDSYLVAEIADSLEADFELFCSGFVGSRDIQNAIDGAEKIGLPINVYELDIDEVREYLPEVLFAIEEPDPLNLSIAIPLFFSTRLARKKSLQIMLSGQGSDELFGGYSKYERVVRLWGYEKLHERLWEDIMDIAQKNLQRDYAASMANTVEMRLPFLDLEIIRYAMGIPPEYKIKRNNSKFIRKYILRSVAKRLNIPKEVVNRQKTAIQYGSGSWKALKILAQKEGFSRQLAKKHGYKNNLQMFVENEFNESISKLLVRSKK